MIFPGVKPGDVVTIDGEEMECTGTTGTPGGSVWLQTVGTYSYYYAQSFSQKDLEEMFNSGRLKLGRWKDERGGSSHWHVWRKYTGFRKVMEICDCGAERDLDWRTIGEGNVDKNSKK